MGTGMQTNESTQPTTAATWTQRSVSFDVKDDNPDDECQPFITSQQAKDEEERSKNSLWSGPRSCVLVKALCYLALFAIVYICVIFSLPLCPVEWDPRPLLFHLKLPKSGSSSVDFTLLMYSVLRPSHRCVSKDVFHTFLHFDWSYIESVEKSDHPQVLASLRDPVDRAVSHFYYIQLQDFTRNLRMRNQSFSEFIRDPLSMMEVGDVWRDGMASVAWLTGNTRSDSWVIRGSDSLSYLERAERLHENVTETCLLAAKRLEQLAWFGLLEEPVRSSRMLSDYLGNWATLHHRTNTNAKKPRVVLSAGERAFVESLMPMDAWLYKYAQRLFEARWAHFVLGHELGAPRMPAFPPQTEGTLLPSGDVLVTSGYAE